MEKKQKGKNKSSSCPKSTAHCLVLPFPTVAFTTPMIQFCKRLEDKGLTITLVLPTSFYKHLYNSSAIPFPIETISDSYDDGDAYFDQPWFRKYYRPTFQKVYSQSLTQLLLKKKKIFPTVDCIIYSSLLPWALDVAKKFGLVGAAFFSKSCAVNSIYYHVHHGLLKVPLGPSEVMVDGLPVLQYHEMPYSYISSYRCTKHDEFHFFMNQFNNFGAADWLFCNTFYELEKRVVDTMQKQKIGRFRPIGPHIPSMYLDKRLKYDQGYSQYAFKPEAHDCIKWLQEKPDSSVVYISIWDSGLKREQITELAWGIKGSNKRFLWEVKKSKQARIPDMFLQETKKQGLVVSWCPQVDVLAQRSVGCFVTDCGWNTVLEATSLGVPMVVFPQCSDQSFNAKFVTDVWKTGVRVKQEHDRSEMVRREEWEGCIKEVMKGERAWEIKRNAEILRELARKSVDEGGSSDRNINEFVASLLTK